MDFAYHYTEEQQRFRAELSSWLDANAPPGPADGSGRPPWERLRRLRLALGEMGWLAPSLPAGQGGAGLTPDHTVVVMEELDRRGLLTVYDAAGSQLRQALLGGGSERLRGELLPALSSGRAVVWTAVLDAHAEPGGDTLGVSARPDADGFILNGEAAFCRPRSDADTSLDAGRIRSRRGDSGACRSGDAAGRQRNHSPHALGRLHSHGGLHRRLGAAHIHARRRGRGLASHAVREARRPHARPARPRGEPRGRGPLAVR